MFFILLPNTSGMLDWSKGITQHATNVVTETENYL